jgi:MFS family permease
LVRKSLDRIQAPVFAGAAFSNSVADITPIAIPLWLAALGMEPLLIGLVVGARYVGPLIFSIQGGALMDRLGARRVMIVFSLLATVVPMIYPYSGWLPFVLCLQFVGGLSESLCWTGSQTISNQVSNGDPQFAGRMIACTRMGTLIAPPFAGFIMEYVGYYGGFIAMSIWGVGTLVSVILIPSSALLSRTSQESRLVDELIPKISDYLSTVKLLAVPIIGTMMAVTSIRQVGSSMQSSFYALHLENSGISETTIGFLIATNGLSGIAAIWTGLFARYLKMDTLLFWSVGLSVISIGLVPFSDNLVFLFCLSAIRGFSLAVSVALLLAILAREVSGGVQGRIIGLRMTCHQVLNVFIPVLLGLLVQLGGIKIGFYFVATVSVLILVCLRRRY